MTDQQKVNFLRGMIDTCIISGEDEGIFFPEMNLIYSIRPHWKKGARIEFNYRSSKVRLPISNKDNTNGTKYVRSAVFFYISDVSDRRNAYRQIMNALEEVTAIYLSQVHNTYETFRQT